MSVIKVFRSYMKEHHPLLRDKDWKVDVRKLSVNEFHSGTIQSLLPQMWSEPVTCWAFYYEEYYQDVVFLLQDKRGVRNIAISLLKNGEPICPVQFH